MDRKVFSKRLKADGVSILLAQFVDIRGIPKVKAVPIEGVEQLLNDGAGFAGGAVVGLGQGAHAPDLAAMPDLDSYSSLPWQKGTGRVACDLYVEGESWPYCSRTVLRTMLARAKKKGYTFKIGFEPEFFLLARNPDGSLRPWDANDQLAKPCYDYKPLGVMLPLLSEIAGHLNTLGWGVYQMDHEDANGQYEVNFKYDEALTSCDRIVLFRMMLPELARRQGAIATFMPKPFQGRTGSGMHIHFSLWDATGRRNLFSDPGHEKTGGNSRLALQFAGGVLDHAAAFTAVSSPTVNCYKRLMIQGSASGYTWVPAYATLGTNNRTHMLRTPASGRIECRVVSSAANPYLAAAALLAAGLDGIERNLNPGLPSAENMYALTEEERRDRKIALLPQNLFQALGCLESDPVIINALGKPLAEEFLKVKHREWYDYHSAVSPWELDHYLPEF